MFMIMLGLLMLFVCIPLAMLLFGFFLVCWIVIVDRMEYLITSKVSDDGSPMSLIEAFNDLKMAMFN